MDKQGTPVYQAETESALGDVVGPTNEPLQTSEA